MVCIIVRIYGLRLKTCDGIKFLDCCSTKPRQCSEDCAFDLSHFSILNCIHKGVLRLGCMVLQLLGCVLLTKRCNLVEIHLQVMCHFLRKLILRRLACHGTDEHKRNQSKDPHHVFSQAG